MARKTPEAIAKERIEEARRKEATALDLAGLRLAALPAEIGQLTALTGLRLDSNQLSTLPAEIGQLKALTGLDLGSNQLSTLPAEIGQLTALTGLYLSNNQLSTLPAEIGRLTALMRLYLHNNQLSTLPTEIGQLTALTRLFLHNNQLSTVPAEIGQLKALKELDLRSNQLSTLPAEIGQLTALTTLLLDDNRLSTLPTEIGQLTALTMLYLQSNQLSTLPAEIGQLTALNRLLLRGNPGLGLPEEALGPTFKELVFGQKQSKAPKEILDAYYRIGDAAGRTLGECKLIVVGRGGAGKTSLIKRLNFERYDLKEAETHGITIRNLVFDGAKGEVKARVWDFGGQLVLHSMHEFFLTARSLYLLVLGERDDMVERDAVYWLQLIRSYAGDAPVVVALNKSAHRERRFDRATLEKNYGPILGWVATECSDDDAEKGGITELRRQLTAALDSEHMESVRRKFPKKWFAIKDELEEMRESYLDYEEFVRRCEEHGEKDAKEQSALSGDLHDLGVALNYGRDPRLRDLTVLRPDWLANGIYAVLRANDQDTKLPAELNNDLAPGGVVTADSLDEIYAKAEKWGMLRRSDYPAEKRAFLLRLMGAFHLSYPLDDEGKTQLVPTLLPPEPPEGAEEPGAESSVANNATKPSPRPSPGVPGEGEGVNRVRLSEAPHVWCARRVQLN